ncbi:MAG TPA: methyltransferase domain-containing protein [Kofleriaceae bacterium]|jgi:SAM-dependent methyltransferase
MKRLYGAAEHLREEAVAHEIPDGASVLELCCGPGRLGLLLKEKNCDYTGFDCNASFVAHAQKAGLNVHQSVLPPLPDVPDVDYVVVVASFYHFKAEAAAFVDSLWNKARKALIILEPINNRSSHANKFISKLSRLMSHPGVGELPVRFSEPEMDSLLSQYQTNTNSFSKLMSDDRDKLYVLYK